MCSGNGHTKIALSATVLILGAGLYSGYWQESAYLSAGLMLGDLYINPDLDGAASNAKRRWWILKGIWKIYERFPHRHWATHYPVIADAIRLLYLALVALPICAFIGLLHDGAQGAMMDTFWAIEQVQTFVRAYPEPCGWVFAGLSIATLLHGVADAIVSEGKKMVDGVKGEAPKKAVRPRTSSVGHALKPAASRQRG